MFAFSQTEKHQYRLRFTMIFKWNLCADVCVKWQVNDNNPGQGKRSRHHNDILLSRNWSKSQPNYQKNVKRTHPYAQYLRILLMIRSNHWNRSPALPLATYSASIEINYNIFENTEICGFWQTYTLHAYIQYSTFLSSETHLKMIVCFCYLLLFCAGATHIYYCKSCCCCCLAVFCDFDRTIGMRFMWCVFDIVCILFFSYILEQFVIKHENSSHTHTQTQTNMKKTNGLYAIINLKRVTTTIKTEKNEISQK